MSTLTIRIDDKLKTQAARQAAVLGVPLTYVVKNALMNFVQSKKVVIGEPEIVIVDEAIQRKMDKIGKLIPL